MATEKTAQTSSNLWVRRIAWSIGGLIAAWALAWAAVPPILKSQLEKRAGEQLGRKVSVGAVDFKPWSLELTVSDLAIATADGTADQLRIQRVYIDAELQSLLRLAPVVDAITVDQPRVLLTHLGGGKYDIDDILARLAKPSDKPAGEPARFALYNLALTGGALDFADKSVNKTHELRDLRVQVPFLSNLDSLRDVKVAPQLAFALNGSRFDSAAQATPFAQTRKTDATVAIQGLDLAPYLPYWPASLPVRLESAVLSANLRVAFEQAGASRVSVSGTVAADRLLVAPARGAAAAQAAATDSMPQLFAMQSLRVELADTQPLARAIRLAGVDLVAPRLTVSRDAAGQTNLQQLFSPPGVASKTVAPKQGKTPTTPTKDPQNSAALPAAAGQGGWTVELARLSLKDGAVGWRDAAVRPAAALALDKLQLDATAIAWPFQAPLQFTGSAQLAGAGLAFQGSATDRQASVTSSLTAFPLQAVAPYLGQFLEPAVTGSVGAEVALGWQAPDATVTLQRLTLADVALRGAADASRSTGKSAAPTPLATIKKLEVTGAQLDLARSAVAVGKLAVTAPSLRVARDAQGQWMFERWLRTGTPAAPKAPPKPDAVGASPWSVAINEIAVDGGTVAYEDLALIRPVAVDVSGLQLRVRNIAHGGKPSAQPMPVTLSARLGAGRLEPGKLDFRGSVVQTPLAVRGDLVAERLPLHAFEAYAADALNVELLRADTSFKGKLAYAQVAAGPRIDVDGDVVLEDFRANSVVASAASGNSSATAVATADPAGARISEELLSWKALAVRGLQLSLAPGTATSVQVRETALSDFFARIAVSDTGRINLQDVLKSSAAGTATAAATTATVAAATPAAIVRIGPMSLVNGRVLFSDRFIKPNYSANLTELNGKLSAFASVPAAGTVQLADLELRGRAQSTASLEVLGKINPLAKPLALDVGAKVRDLELPPLSPYSIKYAGYGIERGKLSVDLAYLVKPDGQLTASNHIVLNQLTFGDKVEGAPNSLPVKLAVALLSDRNGVIDLDLPVSGSINDPQFSLGGVVVKIIVNLIVKAITAPFALLANAFGGGGGEEASTVFFEPGTTTIAPEALPVLDKVAKALADRPSLKLTVVGTSSTEVEREAYRRARLQALVRAEKRRDAVVGGAAAGRGTDTAVVSVTPQEYPALLTQVYKRTDMPKPRNVIGLAKDLPVPEMEALLLANIPVTEDVMRDLAVRRGVAVKDYLAGRELPVERLFLGAAKTVPPEAKWSPRAELAIAQ